MGLGKYNFYLTIANFAVFVICLSIAIYTYNYKYKKMEKLGQQTQSDLYKELQPATKI